ncbi:GPI ethanolamine phosphate transferase 2, partial [Trachymyrmex zeteki]
VCVVFRIKTDLLYRPLIKRLIFMVIDGLRWDFVAGPIGKVAMPLTSDILTNDRGCLLRAILQAPTVTMPRIKAMMTGTVPNFVDVILNFGSKPLHSDNLLFQAKAHGHKLIFYGDETWLSLFPNIFDRHDGTTSFFVTDFTEETDCLLNFKQVDNNVTRHIRNELSNDDWDVMVLHYLGLDHIGHVEGPFGPSIKPKLQEMDKIVAQIAHKVWDWNGDGESTLFIVCGDHGMKDSGGHGGSTPEETTVPLITIGGTVCAYQEDSELRSPMEIQQLDVAVTLSAALGLPIPSTNLGSVFLDRIYDLQDAQRLFLLNYNSRQVFDHFQKFAFREDQIEYTYQKYLDAADLHLDWLNSNETQRDRNIENIALSYHAVLNAMKNLVTNHIVNYDFRLIIVALIVMLQVVFIAFYVETAVWRKKTPSFFLVGFCLCLGLYDLYSFGDTTSFYPTSILKTMLFLLIIGVLYINCNLLYNDQKNVTLELKIYKMLEISTVMHIISFCGSSYIEEEHQTWHFFWSTLIAYLVYKYFTKLLALMMHHRNMVYNSNIVQSIEYYVKHCAMLLLLFLGHIFLRKLNRTGNKWAHLPDIARWLKEDDSKIGMTLLLLTAFALLIWIAYKFEEEEYKQQSLFRNTAIAVCIYLRHMSNDAVVKIPLYSSRIVHTNKRYIAWRLLTTVFYMYLTIFQRNHLFVLSVYLPKLLYEVTYTATMCCSALLTVIVIAVQHAMIPFDDVHRCNNCGTGIRNGHAFAQS